MERLHTPARNTLMDLLFEKAGVGLCLVAPDGTVLRANREWLRSARLTAEEVIGESVIGLFPENREMTLALHARARAGHRVEVPCHARIVKGRTTWWEGTIEPMPMDGGTGLLITAREVLARTEGELPALESGSASEILELGDAFCELDSQFRIVRVNARQEQLTGVPRARSLGKTHWELWPESAQPHSPWWREYHRCIEERVPVAFENYYAPLDLWSSVTAYPTSSGGIAIFFRDVSERKRAEAALAEQKEKYRSLFQNMREGFAYCRMLFDAHGRPDDFVYLDVNDSFGSLTGLRDVVGRKVTEVIPGVREAHPEVFEMYGRVARTGQPERFEIDFRPLEMWLSISAYSPHPDHFVAVFDNITEAKRAEEALRHSEAQLRLATLAAEIGVWSWVPGTSDVSVTANWRRLFGVAPDAKVNLDTWRDAIHPADQERAVRELNDASEHRHEFDTEYRVVHADGTVRWIVDRGRATYDADGRPTMMGGVNVDITRRKLAEEALREADRRKDEFLGMLSHELRNPLAPIRNSSHILRRAAPGSAQARCAQEVIERQTAHLARLVDDLLDVTRIARGKFELRRARVDLGEVLSRAGDDFAPVLHDRGVALRAAVPRGIWADVDATRVSKLVGNLLHNAAKFTRAGDEVTLSLATVAGEAEIRVRDTGAGIEQALLAHLFEPFVQGDRSLARTEGGLGLGLALVKAIVELHGGTVRAESAGRGAGAEFIVRLPLAEAAAAEHAGTPPVQHRGGRRRVLVVEDHPDAAQSLADLISTLGHSVEIAHDGPSAIAKARANPPEVVLCDIGLPGMSGYDVARALREALSGLQLFALTGYAQPKDVQKAIEAGFRGHIAKPPSLTDLERVLA